MPGSISIIDVALRDGLQPLEAFIPTEEKIRLLGRLYDAGVRRVEATSFVTSAAMPQFADAAEVVAAANGFEGLEAQVLVPTAKHAERALRAGARYLSFVLSVSEAHNRSNVRRSPAQSAEEYRHIIEMVREERGIGRIRLNLATAFDCPFDGPVEEEATLSLLEGLIEALPGAEVALCDTTGRAPPTRVTSLFKAAKSRFGPVGGWAFHGHDTYGVGTANAYAAWIAGVSAIDASVAGLGGCPFAPNATGNVATEDLVWMFERMGVGTGIDLDGLLAVAADVCALPGAQTGGRVRTALASRATASCSAAA